MLAVVEDLGGALVGAGLYIIDAEASFTADDLGGVDTEAAHFADEGVGDSVFVRQDGDVTGRKAEAGDGHSDVGFSSAECRQELGRLQ